jgi:hypothetical protein
MVAIVRAAYGDLARQADRWFERLTGGGALAPIRVVHTSDPEPYATGHELSERVRVERVLELCPAAADGDRSHPLLDMAPGGTYDRLRAVHDLVSHAAVGFGFDRDGEFSAWLNEDRMYHGLARWALATELHAEHSVRWTTGSVAEHKATLLPPGILRDSRRRALLEELADRRHLAHQVRDLGGDRRDRFMHDRARTGPDEVHLHRGIELRVVAPVMAAA